MVLASFPTPVAFPSPSLPSPLPISSFPLFPSPSLPVDTDLTLNVPTEQEKKEDRFHPLPRLRIDLASPGKPG